MKHARMIVGLAIPISPVLELVEKYVFGDWEFVKYLAVLVVIDTVLGIVKHYQRHDISSRAYGMIAKKILVYSVVMIVAHVIASFTVEGNTVDSLSWFRYFACSVLMVREGISILENTESIYPGFLPKSIVRRLSEFDSKTGKPMEGGGA
ncbi:MAG: bacteriophage holin [Parabacteroides sp.]